MLTINCRGNFSQVIRFNPSHIQAYVNHGVARYRLGYMRVSFSFRTAN